MPRSSKQKGRPVYIVDGLRTPFLKAKGEPGAFSGSDLAVSVGRTLLKKQSFEPSCLDEVVIGSVLAKPEEANIARVIGLRLGTGKSVPAWTVQRNCASGLQALDTAALDISVGKHDLVLAGGVDSMSHSPLMFKPDMVRWLAKWSRAKSFGQKMKVLSTLKPSLFAPVIALLKGLTDPISTLTMGQTAEEVAFRFGITRQDMDEFSALSHKKVLNAQQKGYLDEVEPLYDTLGNCYEYDDGVRTDSTVEKLAKLRPFFDKHVGHVTPGNSSQVTDGACLLILASEDAIKKYNLSVLAKIVDSEWAACSPEQMGLGPVHAITPILQRQKKELSDIDFYEINEAFAAQVLGCVRAWQDEKYCKEELGLKNALGELDMDRLNVDGGAIALGHPIGASGARVALHLAQVMKRNDAQYGMASLCIGGGQGGAMLLENVSSISGDE